MSGPGGFILLDPREDFEFSIPRLFPAKQRRDFQQLLALDLVLMLGLGPVMVDGEGSKIRAADISGSRIRDN